MFFFFLTKKIKKFTKYH